MALIRLLQRKPDGEIVFREPTSGNVPDYAILSHTWGKEEVNLQDMEFNADRSKAASKAGWRKIQFCAKQAAADGLEYFWVDTCCIDKKNAVELGAAINSMFRWYQNAVRCYVYLPDVSKPNRASDERAWEVAFRTSRWFTRGWTLQELIAPRQVDFFSLEGEQLGSKLTLESQIHEITGIAKNALRGNALSDFSIKERRSWAERRTTTIEEDRAYCLIGIFNVSMALIYGEGNNQAFRRLEEEIHKLYKGVNFEQFAIGLNIASLPEAAQFVAREPELKKMHELLHGLSGRSAVVLHGLGGIGKTQLAIEYVRRHKEKYTAIFWLNANDEDSLRLSFRGIAQQVLKHHPSTRVLIDIDLEEDLDQVVNAVRTWLDCHENTHWLMIFDNYDNPRTSNDPDHSTVDVRRYLPESDQGSIIITTRSATVAQGQRFHVQKLAGLEEGLKILSNMSGRENIENDPNAQTLVMKLDGLPLALSTAGAYLQHVTTSFAEYLRLYEVSWSRLQATSPRLSSYEDRSLYTTWQVTFDRIRKQDAASARLLKLWAYFDKQDVWFRLLRHARSADDECIQKLADDQLSFNKAVRLLCEYGLVHAEPEPSPQQTSGPAGYGVHSCVHSWTKSVLNSEWDDELARLALICVASEVPSSKVDKWWLLQQRLLMHAARQKDSIMSGKLDVKGMERALHNLGNLYKDQGRLAEAEAMYNRALRGYEEALGPKHASTLDTVNNLGNLYKDQGRLSEAEAMYNQALQGKEEVYGTKHTLTLDTVNNLGLLYADQGRLAEAESMYVRALEGKEEAFGTKHVSTLMIVNNLGNLYKDQGRLSEAEAMYNQALQGKEEVYGTKHTSTLNTVNNLGLLYADQGRLAEAEAMYSRALQGYEEALGLKHTSTLSIVNNLGLLYAGQGRLAEAEAMYSRSLQGYEEALGLKHTLTLRTVNNLGLLYAGQGRLAEAEAMYDRALQGTKEALGPKHTSTLMIVNNLGLLYADQGRLDKAEAMYSQALQGYDEALGLKHTSTLSIVNNLGLLYAGQGRLTEAEAMYSRALQGYEEALGPERLSSYLPALGTMFVYGDLLSRTCQKDMAKSLYIRAQRGYATIQGPSSEWCNHLENRLQMLQVSETEVHKPSTTKQKFRKLGRHLNLG